MPLIFLKISLKTKDASTRKDWNALTGVNTSFVFCVLGGFENEHQAKELRLK